MSDIKFFDPTLALQGIIGIIVFAAVVLVPPSNGIMLIVPLLPTATPAVEATHAGGLFVAAGTFPGSIIVFGDRSRIVRAALTDGSVVLSTSQSGCGRQELTS